MTTRSKMDAPGAAALIGLTALFGFNQVVAKISMEGFHPIFMVALRSVGACLLIVLWMRWRGLSLRPSPGTWPYGLGLGLLFTIEFLLAFPAIDLTTVTRVSILYYTMPIWAALGAHFLVPEERLTLLKSLGLALALGGVAVAMTARGQGGEASLLGDILALLGAMAWAGIALVVKVTPMKNEDPAVQLIWQLGVSIPLMLGVCVFIGPLLREVSFVAIAGLTFQIVAIAFLGFLAWLWVLQKYPAGSVVSFSFLSPIFGVFFGWLVLSEPVGLSLLLALALVAAGLWLVNRP